MTVGGILRRAAHLLGGAVPDKALLLEALDSGLAELARPFPLQARCRIQFTNGVAILPPQVLAPLFLVREGKRRPLTVTEEGLLGEDGPATLVYHRVPPKATELGENDRLPYPEDVQMGLPFYCAALCIMGEDPERYDRLMEQYNTKMAAALGRRPTAGVEGGGAL